MKKNRRFIVESWLIEYQDIFNKNGLDRFFKIPPGTIQKFLTHDRKLNDKRIKRAYRSIKKLISDFESPEQNKGSDQKESNLR
ncbi:hypothetical protein [Aquimarina megaterium]|uniref:hypothetical protein n=1 Tax=Aquimarina megaterium TaxID=1443666 RepID=UPI0012679151|nr:hypothetical protein [Aquimarina megaterium]